MYLPHLVQMSTICRVLPIQTRDVMLPYLQKHPSILIVDGDPLDSTTFVQRRPPGVFRQDRIPKHEDEDHITSYYGGEIYNGLYVPPADPEELRRQQQRAAARDNYAYLGSSPFSGTSPRGTHVSPAGGSFPSVTPSPAMATMVYPEHAGHLV